MPIPPPSPPPPPPPPRRPHELYDPEQPLFAAAFSGSPRFPHDQFAFPAWLSLLRDCGLQSKVTPAAFAAAAAHLEERAAQLGMAAPPLLPPPSSSPSPAQQQAAAAAGGAAERARLVQAGDLLVAYLSANAHTLLGGREWWAALGGTAFVPATLGLPGSPRARQVLARYNEAAAAADWPLVWSVLPVVAAERQLPQVWVAAGQPACRSVDWVGSRGKFMLTQAGRAAA